MFSIKWEKESCCIDFDKYYQVDINGTEKQTIRESQNKSCSYRGGSQFQKIEICILRGFRSINKIEYGGR